MKGKIILGLIVALFAVVTWITLNSIKEKSTPKPYNDFVFNGDNRTYPKVDLDVPAAKYK